MGQTLEQALGFFELTSVQAPEQIQTHTPPCFINSFSGEILFELKILTFNYTSLLDNV